MPIVRDLLPARQAMDVEARHGDEGVEGQGAAGDGVEVGGHDAAYRSRWTGRRQCSDSAGRGRLIMPANPPSMMKREDTRASVMTLAASVQIRPGGRRSPGGR